MVYSNSVEINEVDRDIRRGSSESLRTDSFNKKEVYLESSKIGHLRSFSRKLYMKIHEDLKEGSSSKWIGDFILYTSLAELAG